MSHPPFADWLSQTNDVTSTFLAAGQIPGLINLAGGLPDPSAWPVEALADLAREAVQDFPAESLAYGPVTGQPRLRDAIAARFSTEALPLTRDNVLVTTGGTQALAALGLALVMPGQTIAVQTPAYLGALDTWRARMPDYRPMVLEDPRFDPTAAMTGAQFAYTVPNFSNPSGRLVGTDRRRTLIDAARQTGTWLVEDDPYGALYYDGAPLPTMLEMAGPGSPVIYLGTVSKELAPGLRIGWAIAEPAMIEALSAAKQGTDMFSSGLCQMVTALAFERGVPEAIRPHILSMYRARRDALCAAMETHLSDWFTWEKPEGGMFVWARARDSRLNTDALMRAGLAEGVCISPSSVFDPAHRDHGGMRLNFTLNPPEKLEEGIRRLARTTRAVLRDAA